MYKKVTCAHVYMPWQIVALLKIVRMMEAVHNKVALIEVADFACTLACCDALSFCFLSSVFLR